MYEKQPKKMLIMNILDILKRYTDEDHRLSQKEIIEILEREYDMKAERKAVKRNLLNLIDFGYRVEYSESVRINKKGEEEIVYTRFFRRRAEITGRQPAVFTAYPVQPVQRADSEAGGPVQSLFPVTSQIYPDTAGKFSAQ